MLLSLSVPSLCCSAALCCVHLLQFVIHSFVKGHFGCVLCGSQPMDCNAMALNVWGHSPGYQGASHRHLRFLNQCYDLTDPCGS